MVYVNNQKFACESCIKGHRSSSCHHTDRPLFEIKKKGRPLSQCEKCRELRQSRRVHSKCNCNPKDDSATRGQLLISSGTKSRRFIPIVPALPNGLKDILQAARTPSAVPADSRQRVESLLNPCNCKSVWKCKCRTLTSSGPFPVRGANPSETNLTTLAHAAEMCCSNDATAVPRAPAGSSSRPGKQIQNPKRQTSRPVTPASSTHKRLKHNNIRPPPHRPPGPNLPPILVTAPLSSQIQHADPIPSFPTLPPMSAMTSLAGSGCTCGLQCSCPGCVEHRGYEHAAKDRRSCAEGCGTCVDHGAGFALPGENNASTSNTSVIDQFLARAAALPAPPTNRSGFQLDPMNMTVYPMAARETVEHGVIFGLVSLPKLECCGGQCGCSNGMCGCGKSCDGCCAEHGGERADDDVADALVPVGMPASVVRESYALRQSPPVINSCCAGDVAASIA